jgi:hypothetical protein
MGVNGKRHAQDAFCPQGKDPGTYLIGDCVGLRDGLDKQASEKSFVSAGDRTPVVQFIVKHYTDWAKVT